MESEPSLWMDDENADQYDDQDDDQQAEKLAKRRRASFESLKPRSKRQRTDELINVLKQFVNDESDDRLVIDSKGLTMNQLLVYCLYRVKYNSNKRLSPIGKQIYDQGDLVDNKDGFSKTEAITMMP